MTANFAVEQEVTDAKTKQRSITMARQKSEITESVLYVLKKSVSDSGKSRMDLRVVSWNFGQPTLELRSFYQKEGTWLCGRAHGFRTEDVLLILDNPKKAKKVLRLLGLKGKEDIQEAADKRKAVIAA